MTVLLKINGDVFASGRSRFLDSLGAPEPTPKIYVKFLPGDVQIPLLAQVDTGAAWSVLDREIAQALGFFEQAGPPANLSTRSGTIHGKLHRTPLTIRADEGDSLEVDATVFVSSEWLHGNFLGYAGLLERIRFAVDPQTNGFYFGRISER